MRRDNVDDLRAFIAVARARSFTKAAAGLGVSQSALSATVRTLEARLGMRLLTRTTRSVATTEAGERLLASVGPRFDEIEREVEALSALRDKPAGTVRITTVEHAAETLLWPVLARLLPSYPDVSVEIITDYALADLAAGRASPLVPQDLTEHDCIALRLPTHGGLYAWEFYKDGREVRARVQGRAVFNTVSLMRQAALDGIGLAYLPEDMVEGAITEGHLQRVLADWCPPRPGYHLYYPSRREPSPAFALVVQALRVRID